MTKPTGVTGQGECGGCVRKVHVLVRGDLLGMRSVLTTGAGLRPGAKAPQPPPDPTVSVSAARAGVTRDVTGQQSAEGIVGAWTRNGPPPKARTR